MFRLTDFSQTGRILKVQNTFSTRKYPIYYSYDPESMQTYLTKVVTSKDPFVIACFKVHISQNVLPYLHRRSDRHSASLLTVRPENAEVILKIDEQAKKEKCEVIEQRIKQYSDLLKYYNRYYKNSEFRVRIEIIKKFVESFKPTEKSELGKSIESAKELLMTFWQLLDQIDQIEITNQQTRKKVKMFEITTEQQQQEKKIQFLEKFVLQLNKNATTDESTMKRNLVNQLKSQLQACLPILQDRKTILNDFTYYQKGECSDKIEYIYFEYEKQREKLEYENKAIYESNVLFLTKLQIRGLTLRQMIISKDERLTPDFCLDLVKALMDFVLLYGGVENLFLTTENIIVQECGDFHINYFSLVGLEFLKLKKYVSKADFLEILPYLTFDSLYSGDNSQVLIRFIVINFVSAFLRRDMVFDAKAIDFDFEVQAEHLQNEMRNVEKMFPKIVSAQDRRKIREDFDVPFKVNFDAVVQKVFSDGEKITWEFLFSCVRRNNSDESRLNFHSQKQIKSITVLDIVENLQVALTFGLDAFYVVAISMMEVFDHFTTILDKFGEKMAQVKTGREKIGKMRSRVKEQRDFFKRRGWYTNEIFIPVKCSMTYAQILDYSNWVQMLHSQSRVNLQTIKGVQNLLSCLLDLQDTLVAIEPYLDDQLLEDSFLNHQCNYHTQLPPDGKVKSYYLLLKNHLEVKSKKQKQEREKAKHRFGEETVNVRGDRDNEGMFQSSDQEKSNNENEEEEETCSFKGYFWKCCFATLHVVYELIRKYYLRMHEISLNGTVSINGGRYSQWMQHFSPKTPPLTTL